jgi:formate/nitrite transporter FocA (FNT family)
MKAQLITLLLSAASVCSAQEQDVQLHLDKLNKQHGEAQITAIVGGIIVGASTAVSGFGISEIAKGENKEFGGALLGAGGLFLGTGLTMTIIGGKRWRLHGIELKKRQNR